MVHWANENSPWKTLSMTSVYRLADETEEFSFIPNKNHKITAIENIRKRSIPQEKKSTRGNSIQKWQRYLRNTIKVEQENAAVKLTEKQYRHKFPQLLLASP